MKMPRSLKLFICFFMSFWFTNAAQAYVGMAMVPTTQVVQELSRAQAQNNINSLLNRQDVERALSDRGLSKDEISQRLASLSDAELRDLSNQMDQARYGGDILVTILIIVLIIFLIKKM